MSAILEPDLLPLGRKIINACLDDCAVEEYARILPMEYQYSFLSISDLEEERRRDVSS
ncbi:MAG: hypothetical protein MZV63_02505 [Marinilabiliales bacterium]|nr:hypothetical protein [Marinilabiliales bacterium]